MLRAVFRPLPRMSRCFQQKTLLNSATPAAGRFYQPSLAVAARAFSAKPKVEDGTLEGRYATALFMATSGRVGEVYEDLRTLRTMMNESPDFKLMVETPGIDPESKAAAMETICKSVGTDQAVVNFLKVLIENKRMYLLKRMIDLYEVFYRAEKGLVPCTVTSATPLSTSQQSEVEAAMQKRAGAGKQLIMEFNTNPALLGGLMVKMGEAVFDNSVSTRLERLQTQLLAPLA